jgi:hypothetical protein
MGFSGEPQTIWLDGHSAPSDANDRNMQVVDDFTFTDRHDHVWRTPAGCIVDGASIPRALWTLVGSPYTGHYRRASVVHDKACEDAKNAPDPTAARLAADRMFFEACLAGGCKWFEAAYLYVGVRIGAILANSGPELLTADDGPAIARPQDRDVIDAYQHIAQQVTQAGETYDPEEMERRTTAAQAQWTGLKMALSIT